MSRADERAAGQGALDITPELRLPALEVRQGQNRLLYTFAVDGKQLPLFTTVSRVHRDVDARIAGYQRPEVLSHITAIRKYLESSDPMIPNALVVAFDKRVYFEPMRQSDASFSRPGTLVIPVDPDCPDEEKPGWVVDGQQRSAAIRDARIDSFPICVTAFLTDSESDQRSQFILVNSTKPLPKGLIHELLPSTSGALPPALQQRRFPAYLLDRLNYDESSPLRLMINTPTTPGGIIKDNSVLRMLENSLSDGALYRFRDPETGEGDADAMLSMLSNYWSAVRVVFQDSWGLPPRKSRLMHGVGIISLGYTMDAISERKWISGPPSMDEFRVDLEILAPLCQWTSGNWTFGADITRRWNDLQNTPRDIKMLTNYFMFHYHQMTRKDSPRET